MIAAAVSAAVSTLDLQGRDIMPDLINRVHLQAEQLDNPNIIKAIETFAEWVVASEFKPLLPGLERCFDKEREDRIGPLVNAIGSGNGV